MLAKPLKTCYEEYINGFILKIEQHTNKRALFRVTYGPNMRDNLTYLDAAQSYGLCVFHALSMGGDLNSTGE